MLSERLFENLVNGDRPAARSLVEDTIRGGMSAEKLVGEVFWPTYELVSKLYRADQLSRLSHHMATRLLRVLVDQAALRFTKQALAGEVEKHHITSWRDGADGVTAFFVGEVAAAQSPAGEMETTPR